MQKNLSKSNHISDRKEYEKKEPAMQFHCIVNRSDFPFPISHFLSIRYIFTESGEMYRKINIDSDYVTEKKKMPHRIHFHCSASHSMLIESHRFDSILYIFFRYLFPIRESAFRMSNRYAFEKIMYDVFFLWE